MVIRPLSEDTVTAVMLVQLGFSPVTMEFGTNKETNWLEQDMWELQNKVILYHFLQTEILRLLVAMETIIYLGQFGFSQGLLECGINKGVNYLEMEQLEAHSKDSQWQYLLMEILLLKVDHKTMDMLVLLGFSQNQQAIGLNKETN